MIDFRNYGMGVLTILLGLAGTPIFAQNILLPPKNGNTYVIAHRGVHDDIPENSLAAYQKAIDLGCDFIEIDIRTTKDGGLVSVHNSTIDAYVNGAKGKVEDFTLQEIRALDIGEKVGAQWKGTQVPTFEEILKLSAGKIGIYLDLKAADPGVLIPLLRKYQMSEKTIWYLSGGEQELIQTIQSQCPECLVMPDPGEESYISKVAEMYEPKFLATDMGQLSAGFVNQARLSGAKVIVDDRAANPEEWTQILRWGVAGIQTDRPELLIQFLKSKP